jgi:hypothetical protein
MSRSPNLTDNLESLGASNGSLAPHAKAASKQDRVDEHERNVTDGVEAESHPTPAPMTISTLTVKMANARTS